MRPLIAAPVLAAFVITAAAGIASAQPVDSLSGFAQASAACAAITEGKPAAPAIKAAGLVAGAPEPPALQTFFFKDVPRVDWWKRPVSEGRVIVGYEPVANKCRVFLLGVARRDAAQRARDALPPGWWAYEEGKTWVRRREDGTLSVMTVLPGDESKGIGPDTLTAMAHVWHNTAK